MTCGMHYFISIPNNTSVKHPLEICEGKCGCGSSALADEEIEFRYNPSLKYVIIFETSRAYLLIRIQVSVKHA